MKIVLLFGMFASEHYNTIVENSNGVIQYAADALQKSFVEGIGTLNKDTEVINLPFIGSYPKRYKSITFPSGLFSYITQNHNLIAWHDVGFCNISVIKSESRKKHAYRALKQWANKYPNEEKSIIIYSVHKPFLEACVKLKYQYKNIKVILIVPDLPEYMSSRKSVFKDFLIKVYNKDLKYLYNSVDGFILLSKYMVDFLHIKMKPWIVIEGIFNNVSDSNNDERSSDSSVKTVFYSGTLAERYGILNLVKAFSALEDRNINLIICGAGDTEDIIKRYANNDSRIIYKGQLPRQKVLSLQRSSTLLVNPRTPEGEFTKYSFPSKTMEYLASGVPTLIYKLPGIPDEYYDYCFTIDKLGVTELKLKLYEILQMDRGILNKMGERAREFIISNKNPIAQCNKIITLINKCYSE